MQEEEEQFLLKKAKFYGLTRMTPALYASYHGGGDESEYHHYAWSCVRDIRGYLPQPMLHVDLEQQLWYEINVPACFQDMNRIGIELSVLARGKNNDEALQKARMLRCAARRMIEEWDKPETKEVWGSVDASQIDLVPYLRKLQEAGKQHGSEMAKGLSRVARELRHRWVALFGKKERADSDSESDEDE